MATVATPYAAGTISSVSGTTINLSGGAVAGWVGRCILLADGPGYGQSRKIVSVVSATQITIDYAFNISPFASFGWTESDPVAGNTFRISHAPADIVDGTTVIADGGTLSYRFVGASTFSGGAFLYAANARIEMSSSSIAAGSPATDLDRVTFRFGDIDQYGNTYNGCFLIDNATAPSGFGTGSASTKDPHFHFYAGQIRFTGAAPFWRFHSDDNEITRIVGVNIDGNSGGRYTITAKTMIKDCVYYNMQSASGPFNPKKPSAGASGIITNIKVSKSLQGLYHYWTDSKSVSAEGINTDVSVSKLVRFANTTVSGETLTLLDNNIPVLQAMPLLYTNSNGTYSNTFRLSQYLNAKYVSAAGVAITDSTRFVIRDNVPTVVYDSAVTTGEIPKQTLCYRDMTILNIGDYSWANAGGTTYAPYAIAAMSYLYQAASLPLPLSTSQSINLVGLVDTDVSQTNRATVDAYATIDTFDQFYDRAKSWSVDNLAAANPSFGAQVAVGNGTELNLGAFNIVVDGTAASPFAVVGNTITVKSTGLVAGSKFATLRTTGSVTLANGGKINASYTTGTGSFAGISISGLQAGSRVQIYNVSDSVELYNGVVAGTSYGDIFPFSGADTIRLRVTKSGYLPWLGTATNLPGGISFSVAQTVDSVCVANGIDGSLVTGITPDNLNLHLDLSEADGVLEVPSIYAYVCYLQTTASGIADFFNCITAEDVYNYRINVALLLDNVNSAPVQIVNGRLYRADAANIIAAASGPIHIYEERKGTVLDLGTVTNMVAELYAMQGLKAGSPMNVTPSSRSAAGITLAISGDGVTTTTVTRT